METLEEFSKFIQDAIIQKVEYSAIYDINTGRVTGVGPTSAFSEYKNKVQIPNDIALDILNSKIPMSKCIIDFENNNLEITEVKTLYTIDDVLHRVTEKKFSSEEYFDLYIVCDKKKKTLTLELTKELMGTRKLEKGRQAKNRNIRWDGQTNMDFYITDYNDPNILHQMFRIVLSDLNGKKVKLTEIEFPENFSVYTRRLLKNYVLEIK